MTRRIIWSTRAHDDKIEIYKYWNKRNKSKQETKRTD